MFLLGCMPPATWRGRRAMRKFTRMSFRISAVAGLVSLLCGLLSASAASQDVRPQAAIGYLVICKQTYPYSPSQTVQFSLSRATGRPTVTVPAEGCTHPIKTASGTDIVREAAYSSNGSGDCTAAAGYSGCWFLKTCRTVPA